MLCNLHTHTTYCDGKDTPEQIVQAAIAQGFRSIGFSGHGTTPYDLRYCMQDMDGYRAEITGLKEKYKKDIEIYLGIEEDSGAPVNRAHYDYLIGSSHYCCVDGKYFSVDSGYEYLKKCVDCFEGNPVAMAKAYYEDFCRYIHNRKPDIVGHFDLITKWDEEYAPFLLDKKEYHALAEKYMTYAAGSGCLFEVNTGAMARGLRTAPYPCENLLYILKKNANGIVLSSDAHTAEKLSFGFADAKKCLKDVGFTEVFVRFQGKFVADPL